MSLLSKHLQQNILYFTNTFKASQKPENSVETWILLLPLEVEIEQIHSYSQKGFENELKGRRTQ